MNMKMKYLSGLFLSVLIALTACHKEEAIIPSNEGMPTRFEFPQGNQPWDQDIIDIQKKFGIYLIYKDFSSDDFNRSWTGGGGSYTGSDLTDEQARWYVDFMKNHVFAYLTPEITKKVLPIYYYLVYDFYIPNTFGTITFKVPQNNYFDGLDFWLVCLEGEPDPTSGEQILKPVDAKTYHQRRGMIMQKIFAKAVETGTIAIPDEFYDGFDFKTGLVTGIGKESDPNYYLNRGFVDRIFGLMFDQTIYVYEIPTREDAFLDYVNIAMRYTQEEFDQHYPADKYPLIRQKYDFVNRLMSETYHIDLKAIAQGPEVLE